MLFLDKKNENSGFAKVEHSIINKGIGIVKIKEERYGIVYFTTFYEVFKRQLNLEDSEIIPKDIVPQHANTKSYCLKYEVSKDSNIEKSANSKKNLPNDDSINTMNSSFINSSGSISTKSSVSHVSSTSDSNCIKCHQALPSFKIFTVRSTPYCSHMYCALCYRGRTQEIIGIVNRSGKLEEDMLKCYVIPCKELMSLDMVMRGASANGYPVDETKLTKCCKSVEIYKTISKSHCYACRRRI